MDVLIQSLVILFGIFLISISIFMFIHPKTAIQYLRKGGSTNFINYSELTLRGAWGMILVLGAELSKFPDVFQVVGTFTVITTIILLFTPRKWHAAYAVWCAGRFTPLYVRVASPFSLAFGVFLIYAVI